MKKFGSRGDVFLAPPLDPPMVSMADIEGIPRVRPVPSKFVFNSTCGVGLQDEEEIIIGTKYNGIVSVKYPLLDGNIRFSLN